MAEIISGIYKITNTVTGDFYIGSSKNIKSRWACHKCQSTWNKCPNNPMYLDMNELGVDKFEFKILAEVEIGSLKEMEQQFIETLKPIYNNYNAKGLDAERKKEHHKKYQKSDKYKECQKEHYQQNREKYKEYQNKYNNQSCCYNGKILTLAALSKRFYRAGIAHPAIEAKKYLVL